VAALVGGAEAPWALVSDLPVFSRDGESALWDPQRRARSVAPREARTFE